MVMKGDWLDWTVLVLVVIGCFNWGVYAFNYNLIELIFGYGVLSKILYSFIALSGAYTIYLAVKD